MQRLLRALLTFIVVIGSQGVWSSSALMPSPPELGADSYILMDASSGRVLVENDAEKRLEPASLTKMMTAYIADREMAEGRLSTDEEVRVSVNAWQTGGSRMFIQEGTSVTVGELMRVLSSSPAMTPVWPLPSISPAARNPLRK